MAKDPYRAELLPSGTRARLITERFAQNTTYLLRIFEQKPDSSGQEVDHQIFRKKCVKRQM